MTETWEQMETRHAKERAELMRRMVRCSYKAGADGRVPKEGPRLDLINESVAEKHGIPPRILLSDERNRRVAYARFEAFTQAREAGFTLTEIGNFWGRPETQ